MSKWIVCRVFTTLTCLAFASANTALALSVLKATQEGQPAPNAAQREQNIPPLQVGKPIEREMKGGDAHSFHLILTADQFVHLVVDQRGIDVVLTLFGPDSRQIVEVDSPNGTQGPEPLSFIAEIPGSYRLEVKSLEKDAKPGRYAVKVESVREATEEDRSRIAAQRVLDRTRMAAQEAFAQGDTLFAKGSKESLERAIERYKEAAELWRSVASRREEGIALKNIAVSYSRIGEKQRALDYYEQALLISRAIRDASGEADELNEMGVIHTRLGDHRNALECYNKALAIRRSTGDHKGEGILLLDIGAVYDTLGDKEQVLNYYNQALPLLRESGGRQAYAIVLNNLGFFHLGSRDIEESLSYFRQAYDIFHLLRDGKNEGLALMNIGGVYDLVGDKQKAIDYFKQSLAISHTVGDPILEATAHNNIGGALDDLGQKQQALEFYQQALALFRALKDPSGEAGALNNIGLIHNALGEKQKALDFFNQALPLRRAVGDRQGEAITLYNIGSIYYDLGDNHRALELYNLALPLNRTVRDYQHEAMTLTGIGTAYERSGDSKRAINFYHQAIESRETARAATRIEEFKIKLAEQGASVYGYAISLHMRRREPRQAFNLTERARARALLDQLANIQVKLRKGLSPQISQKEQSIKREISDLQQRLRREVAKKTAEVNEKEILSLDSQIAAKEREYEDLIIQLKLVNAEYATLRSVDALALSSVQRLLNRTTSLVSYFVTTRGLFIFVVTRDSFRAIEVPVNETDLKSSINWVRGFANLVNPRPESLKQLHAWLIAPIKQYLKTPAVCIIPHGILHYLPFAALTDGKKYFGEEHTIFHIPSASVLPFIQKKSKPVGNQVLAVAQSQAEGLPALQYADDEANVVANLYDTEALVTGKASKSEVLKRAGEYNIIHIAAHAELNTANPIFSRIMLGPDTNSSGALEVRDVYDLDLSKASLVVLSACETQLGTHSKGDDIVGLNRAFIYAGTPTVIASLWTVDDESTSYLMKAFYTHLKSGINKAEALQAAQSDTRKKYPHPYYWAGFVLTGDPGERAKK